MRLKQVDLVSSKYLAIWLKMEFGEGDKANNKLKSKPPIELYHIFKVFIRE